VSRQTQEQRNRLWYDDPVPLSSPRGPVSAALIGMIAEPPSGAPVDPDLEWLEVIEDAAVDDDLGPAGRTAGPKRRPESSPVELSLTWSPPQRAAHIDEDL
jgi:hypothetical protein